MFGKKLVMKIEGMSCKHCTKRVEDALKNVEGVIGVSVNLKNKEAVVKYKDQVNVDDLKKAVLDLDYQVGEIK